MPTQVILPKQPGTEASLKCGKGEHRSRFWLSRSDVAGKRAEVHLVDRRKEPLNLAPTTRHSVPGEIQHHFQISCDLFHMRARKVTAMVSIEDGGNPAEPPARIIFTPNGLMECQRGLKRCGVGKSQEIAWYPSAEVVQDDREPGASRLTTFIKQPDGQERVICLPDDIGGICLKAIDQIKLVSIGSGAFMSQCHQSGIKRFDDRIHLIIARMWPALFLCDLSHLTVNCRNGALRFP